ncbi:MAG: aldo/keto reductase [Kofleriaceae bacterium]
MRYASLGRTGLSVSRLAMGTGTFGKQTDEAESHRILDRVADAGVTLIDTADIYPAGADADHPLGSSEVITGRWLANKRARFILATKGGGPTGPAAWDRGASRKHLLDAIDASLRRLGTDYIDLYQLHMDDPATPLDELAETMDTIVRTGRARYIGVSNFLAYRLARAIGRQDALHLARFVSVQPRYNLLFRGIERELLPLAREESIAVLPYNPLAGGLLTGRYQRAETPTTGRFSQELGAFGAMYRSRYWNEREFETIASLQSLAASRELALPTLAVAWLLANSTITSVILGASNAGQLAPTLAAAEVTLDATMTSTLDEITAQYRDVATSV